MRTPSDCQYLVLTGKVPPEESRISISSDLGGALRGWDSTTRISPIFPLKSGEIQSGRGTSPDLGDAVVFLGPVHPRLYLDDCPDAEEWDTWISFGAFNLVASLEPEMAEEVLLPWADESGVPLEYWRAGESGYTTVRTHPSSGVPGDAKTRLEEVSNLQIPAELTASTSEFLAQSALTMARAKSYFPEALPDLELHLRQVASTLHGMSAVGSSDSITYRALGLLIQINAGMSRFSSQALSGTGPLLITECHFWTHSLLGIGVAVRGIHRLSRFLENTVGEARLPQRIEALKNINLAQPSGTLAELSDGHPVWETDLLEMPLAEKGRQEEVVPVLTFFSARDGFKSTPVTLSAALGCVTHCSTQKWSLVTITHELAHNLVRGVLGVLYPRLRPHTGRAVELDATDDYELSEAFGILNRWIEHYEVPSDMLSLSRLHVIQSAAAMEEAALGRKPPLESEEALRDVLERWHHEIEELMTHILDYLYFFDGSSSEYVNSIWSSWGVIPNIDSRVQEYVVRSLCALLASQPVISPEETIDMVSDTVLRPCLERLRSEAPGSQYLDAAIGLLDQDSQAYEGIRTEVEHRVYLVRFASRILVSEELRDAVNRTPEAVGDPQVRGGFPHRVSRMDGIPIRNPLQFVRKFSLAAEPDTANALWLLTMLAFNGFSEAAVTGTRDETDAST